MTVRFTWDDFKNRSNQTKHDGISFQIAARVFLDPLRLTRQDRVEGNEERWQTIGIVNGVVLLLVAHTIVEFGPDDEQIEEIRIISARRATPRERKHYENQ